MENVHYTDSLGYEVYVGNVVGFNEEFAEMGEKSYVVVDLPNYADMVDMVEITDISYNVTTKEEKYTVVVPVQVISVKPYKVGAI